MLAKVPGFKFSIASSRKSSWEVRAPRLFQSSSPLPVAAGTTRYGLNICVPPKFLCGSPTPRVMVSEGGIFESELGTESGAFRKRISALIIRHTREILLPLSLLSVMSGDNETAICIPGRGSHQPLALPTPRSWTSQPPEWCNINVSCLNHAGYGAFHTAAQTIWLHGLLNVSSPLKINSKWTATKWALLKLIPRD